MRILRLTVCSGISVNPLRLSKKVNSIKVHSVPVERKNFTLIEFDHKLLTVHFCLSEICIAVIDATE